MVHHQSHPFLCRQANENHFLSLFYVQKNIFCVPVSSILCKRLQLYVIHISNSLLGCCEVHFISPERFCSLIIVETSFIISNFGKLTNKFCNRYKLFYTCCGDLNLTLLYPNFFGSLASPRGGRTDPLHQQSHFGLKLCGILYIT